MDTALLLKVAMPAGLAVVLYLVIIRITARHYCLKLRSKNVELELHPGDGGPPSPPQR